MVDRDELQALIETDLNAWSGNGTSIDVLSAAIHYAQTYADIPCDEIAEMVRFQATSRDICIEPQQLLRLSTLAAQGGNI